jgi:hypothetical protein
MVDLIKPVRNPRWKGDVMVIGDDAANDLTAAEIEGLIWLENAPAFEAVIIDEKGMPLRITTTDPRAFAVHKHWLAKRVDRDPVKRQRDAQQAVAVARIVRDHFHHLPFREQELLAIPKEVVADATPLFSDQG